MPLTLSDFDRAVTEALTLKTPGELDDAELGDLLLIARDVVSTSATPAAAEQDLMQRMRQWEANKYLGERPGAGALFAPIPINPRAEKVTKVIAALNNGAYRKLPLQPWETRLASLTTVTLAPAPAPPVPIPPTAVRATSTFTAEDPHRFGSPLRALSLEVSRVTPGNSLVVYYQLGTRLIPAKTTSTAGANGAWLVSVDPSFVAVAASWSFGGEYHPAINDVARTGQTLIVRQRDPQGVEGVGYEVLLGPIARPLVPYQPGESPSDRQIIVLLERDSPGGRVRSNGRELRWYPGGGAPSMPVSQAWAAYLRRNRPYERAQEEARQWQRDLAEHHAKETAYRDGLRSRLSAASPTDRAAIFDAAVDMPYARSWAAIESHAQRLMVQYRAAGVTRPTRVNNAAPWLRALAP